MNQKAHNEETQKETHVIWQRLVQKGEVQLVDPPKQERKDPYDTPEYAAFVESMAAHCRCEPSSCRPCDGVLAGGVCDGMDWTERDREEPDED